MKAEEVSILDLYKNNKFGNIKQVDRHLIFPVEQLARYQIPWTPSGKSANASGKISFGKVNGVAVRNGVKSDTYKKEGDYKKGSQTKGDVGDKNASKALWSSLLKKTDVPVNSNIEKKGTSEKKNPPLEKWKVVSVNEKGPLLIPRGLINNGNICFMNAILQPLVHCAPFYRFIMDFSSHTSHNFKIKIPVLDSIVEFMKEFHHGTKVEPTEEDFAFLAEYIYDAIRLRTKMDSLKGRQEDAEEFLGFLLDGLHEELLLTVDKAKVELEQTTDEWLEVGKKNKTVITQRTEIQPSQITRIFGGRLRSVVKTSGSKESITLEPFQTLQIDITSQHIFKLEDAILNICRPEILEDFASHNNSTTTKQTFFEEIPPILIISLKRFVYDTNIGKTQKVDKHIDFPTKLSFSPEVMAPTFKKAIPPYTLFAVVNHHGKLAQGGHYTSDVKHQNGLWYRFDDANVSNVEEAVVISKQGDRQPYMLFYIRSEN